MRNRVTWLEIIILACITAAAGIICGVWAFKYYKTSKPAGEDNAAYFSSVYAEKKNDFSNLENNSDTSGNSSDSVIIDSTRASAYQKLKNGERINVLVLGDETCTGYGSESDTVWLDTLSQKLYDEYGSSVYITNLAYNYATAFIQYYEVKALDNNVDYDLILVSVGANDVRTDYKTGFDSQYEALVRAAKSKYPNAELLTVIQSTEGQTSQKSEAIRAITEHYNGDCIDAAATFLLSSNAELNYDGVFPNDTGYELYVTATMQTIALCVGEDKKTTEFPSEVLYEDAAAYDSYQYISFSSMSETAPGVYQTTVKKDFDVFSLLYVLNGDGGVYRLYVNDYEYEYRDTKWTQSSERRQVSIFESKEGDSFTGNTKIRIEVEDTNNKPRILGLIVSGIDQ
ncbi:MAG: SGNH/GDSL hydrolase family protein [Oscillospiraceae bacterium]|nr:SGNH/GDSL hydrolase family protein [Oscillospiraceae bacterium]